MNYIGSKYSLLSFITNTITNVVGGDLSDKVFCDIFAGTGIVGRTFKPMVKKVISNDLEYYSYVLNRNYLGISDDIPNKEDYIRQLNKEIVNYKNNNDMANYAIQVHAMKSNARSFGFMKLGDIAYDHEMKSKANDTLYVNEHFSELENEVRNVINIITNYMAM